MKNYKFSLIVCIYNIENYLHKCLESIEKQKINNVNYEVILIDDGSTDKSREICQEYIKKNDDFKYFYKKNGGIASARNYGLSKSKGEYIWFIDGDDYISENAIACLDKEIQDNDVLIFNYYKVCNLKIKQNSDIKQNFFDKKKVIFCNPSVWSKIIKKNFLKNNNLCFPDGKIYEDLFITPKIILYTDKIKCISEYLYYYVIRDNSIMNQNKFNKNRDDKLFIIDNIIKLFKEEQKYNLYFSELEYLSIKHLIFMYSQEILLYDRNVYVMRLNKINEKMKKEFPKWLKNEYLKKGNKFSKIYAVLFKFKFYRICKIIIRFAKKIQIL